MRHTLWLTHTRCASNLSFQNVCESSDSSEGKVLPMDENNVVASIKRPDEYGVFADHWPNLTHGGRLFKVLRLSVQCRAGEEEFQQLLSDFEEWRDFVCDSG